MKTRTTLTVEKALLEAAHEQGVNISRLLENALRSYLEGNGSQQPQQPRSLEQPNQSPKEDLKSLLPPEALERLEKHGFNINDNDWLKRVIRESLNKTIVELGFEIFDPKTGTYVLLE